MNTLSNLQTEYGFRISTARMMIESYQKRIGSRKGDFEITDVTFIGDNTKEVELTCTYCGEVVIRRVKNFEHLRKVKCECRAERSLAAQEEKREKRKAEKKAARDYVIQNEIGKEYGEFRIIGLKDEYFDAECTICGANKRIFANTVLNGSWKDTKCHTHRRVVEKFDESYIGKKNNMLTVIGITHDEKSGRKRFVCRCDCGNIYRIKPSLWERGDVRSCGCYQINRSKDAIPEERIKAIYRGMRNRCLNKESRDYPLYGGRGIKICEEWMDFENFLKWSLENGYDNTRTIDRIDSSGNYEPLNCRWATWYVQNRNKRPRRAVV